jgi:TctA family transporter
MHFIFLLARIYPFWALPMAIVLAQLAIFFRRRESGLQYSSMAGVVLLTAGIFAWFFFRGDIHSDDWVRTIFGS